MAGEDQLYFRQMLSGRDHAVGDPVATQMVNFSYIIGDRATGEALIVDPTYAVGELVAAAGAEGMHIAGVLATHHHTDHVGGSMMGYAIQGLAELMSMVSVPVHAHHDEVQSIAQVTGLDARDLVAHDSGDRVRVGAVEVELLHTPGHTPGSQCFLVDGKLVAGDTLFLDGCGRTDLPGSDPSAMYDSLQKLSGLPGTTVIYPGHHYSVASVGTLDAVRESNFVFKPQTREAWLAIFAG